MPGRLKMLAEESNTFGRRDFLDGALRVVLRALRNEESLPIPSISVHLLREYPTCQMSLEKIEKELIRMAMDHSVRIALSGETVGEV